MYTFTFYFDWKLDVLFFKSWKTLQFYLITKPLRFDINPTQMVKVPV